MVRIQAEITTNRCSIGSTSMEFSVLQRFLTGFGLTLTISQATKAVFILKYKGMGGI